MNCPQHNIELVNRKGISKKTGKPYDFWACTTKTDDKYCDYTYNAVKNATTSSVAPERQELMGKVLAGIVATQIKHEDTLKKIMQMLASIGGRVDPEPNPNQTKVPF